MMPEVVTCITNEELPVIVRQQAVYSLRRIAEEIPKEVLVILSLIFPGDILIPTLIFQYSML